MSSQFEYYYTFPITLNDGTSYYEHDEINQIMNDNMLFDHQMTSNVLNTCFYDVVSKVGHLEELHYLLQIQLEKFVAQTVSNPTSENNKEKIIKKEQWFDYTEFLFNQMYKHHKEFFCESVINWIKHQRKELNLSKNENQTQHTTANKKKKLYDILEFDEKTKQLKYEIIIAFLKNNGPNVDRKFVTEINNELYWNAGKGSKQYLAAFIHICLNLNLIADKYSAPTYKSILKNTFNIDFNHTPLKSIKNLPPSEEYLKPFLSLNAHLKKAF